MRPLCRPLTPAALQVSNEAFASRLQKAVTSRVGDAGVVQRRRHELQDSEVAFRKTSRTRRNRSNQRECALVDVRRRGMVRPEKSLNPSGYEPRGYVIWDRVTGVVVRVGQGDVATRLRAHQTDPAIARLGGELLVTWADVSPTFRSGVEKYLASQYRPIIGERYPDTPAIPVNLRVRPEGGKPLARYNSGWFTQKGYWCSGCHLTGVPLAGSKTSSGTTTSQDSARNPS